MSAAPVDAAVDIDAGTSSPSAVSAPCESGPPLAASAHVRLASRAVDGPLLELCAAQDVVEFARIGPVVDAGVASGDVSAYAEIAPNNYFLRLVAQGAETCGNAVGPLFGGPVLGRDGGFFTVTAIGALDRDSGATPLTIEVEKGPPPSAGCDE